MSYGFPAKGDTKTDAILDAEAGFQKVITMFPAHEVDKEDALRNMHAVVNQLGEPTAGEQVSIYMTGYIASEDGRVTGCNIGCSASIGKKPATT